MVTPPTQTVCASLRTAAKAVGGPRMAYVGGPRLVGVLATDVQAVLLVEVHYLRVRPRTGKAGVHNAEITQEAYRRPMSF